MEDLSLTEILTQTVTEICKSSKALYASVYIQFTDSPLKVFSSVPPGRIFHKEKKQTPQQQINLDYATTQLRQKNGDLHQSKRINGNTVFVTLPFSPSSF